MALPRSNNIMEDFFFLFKGIGILLLTISIGVGVSQFGVDSLTNKKDTAKLINLTFLSEGQYQIAFLGEKIRTPSPLILGSIKSNHGQVLCCFGRRQFCFSTTLQMGKVDVLCKRIKEKIVPWKSKMWQFIHLFF